MSWGRLLGSLALASAALGCAGAPDEHVLELLTFRQRGLSVALNEELLFHFSADLDRGSITSDSLRVLDEQGREVAGERTVRGSALSFLPALPCASDLSDGGLRPGADYRVVLGGFPRPDGIRSKAGALLSATLLLSFSTAQVGGSGPLFLDPFLGPFPLLPRSDRLEEGVLALVCGEALDPSSVPRCRFRLTRASEPGTITLEARLVVNRREHAELLLVPAGESMLAAGRLAPDRYYLEPLDRELRTLGGRTVEPGWVPQWPMTVSRARIAVDFTAPRVRSTEPPPGCAGTALWSAERGVHVRYPAAAGDGLSGAIELADHPLIIRVQATALTLAAGREVDLSAHHGPVVLRSQTSIDIRGSLRRAGASRDKEHNPLTLALTEAEKLPDGERGTLSAWIQALLDPDAQWAQEPWTVLIAGGDIRVPKGGAIDVEGPLVLIAGGWIRREGKIVAQDDLWKTPEGGDGAYSHTGRLRILPLALDPPLVNPLRTQLTIGLLTGPFPWSLRTDSWNLLLVGRQGAGRMSGELLPVADVLASSAPLATGPVRALVRLVLDPGRGEAWDPPRLERLEIEASPGRVREAGRD